ncbi:MULTISPECIES: VWA domain-containing protein [unclassified Kitasatospora]|uniref:vWA domain-containing protein n=1 Tax=unclassified Kitasatospora TaxID=2633591 RepID=UPI001ADEDC9D|nr:VWA domain-containing protein [Kitasatospora sp. RG8]MBP0450473.1 VWA domain-containing protein [Kitasatospora sp. RG8]
MADVKGVLLPAYVVADESGSMAVCERELTDGLVSLHESLRAAPMLADKVRLAIVGFADDVEERLALTDVRNEVRLPQFVIRGLTSYGSAFHDLLRRIPDDVARLKREGYLVHRPVVFFLSDGAPTDGEAWRTPHRQLTDKGVTKAAPNIIAVGVGHAEARTMVEVATRPEFAFVSVPGADVGRSITVFFEMLTESLIQSGNSLVANRPELIIQKPDPNLMRVAIDMV